MKLIFTACSKALRVTVNNILSTCIGRKIFKKSVLNREIAFADRNRNDGVRLLKDNAPVSF